jgi:hypothetical protein
MNMENEIAFWIRSLRSEGIPISDSMIKTWSLNLVKESGIEKLINGFKASYGWIQSFKKRFNFSTRTKSHVGQIKPDDYEEIAKTFAQETINKAISLGVEKIRNADQTAAFYDILPKNSRRKGI